ncbi:MAG: C39 family peptidase [Mobilitalea sp.]
MIIKELNFPKITQNDKGVGYGGSQEWFIKNWQRQAGCGCTSGTNIAAYYASTAPNMTKLYQGDSKEYKKDEFVKVMEEMFTYMKPGILGYPYIYKFSKQFVKYCKEREVLMEANILTKYKSVDDAFEYVKSSIDAGNPIAVLILFHRAKQLREDNWHWVTITGYIVDTDNNETQIIRSNYGKREIISSDVMFEVHSRNKIRMVNFERIQSVCFPKVEE